MDPVARIVPDAFQSRHSMSQDLSESGRLCESTVGEYPSEGAAADSGCLHNNASESPNLHGV